MTTIARDAPRSGSVTNTASRHAEFMQIWEEGYVSRRISFEIMHVPGVFFVDGRALRRADGSLDRPKILHYVDAMMASQPVFRLRLQRSLLGLAAPAWVPDDDFDLSRHVVFAEGVAQRGTADLRTLAGDHDGIMPLRHPLWRLRVTELDDGDVAIGTMLHHSSVDGMSGMKIMSLISTKSPDDPLPAPRDPFADVRPARGWELPFLALTRWWGELPDHRGQTVWRSWASKPFVRRIRRVAARNLLPLLYDAGGASARETALAPRHSAFRRTNAAATGRRARQLGGSLSDLLLASTIHAWPGRERQVRMRFPVSFHSATGPQARNNVRDMDVAGDADASLEETMRSVHTQVAERDSAWDGRTVPGHPIGYTTLLPWTTRPRYFCGGEVHTIVPFPGSLGTDRLAAAGIMYNGSLFIGATMPIDADVEAAVDRIHAGMTGGAHPDRR